MKTGLKKITIEVGGKKIDFTPEEAKELKNILAELFGADKTVYVHHHDYWWQRPYTVWCSDTTSIGNTSSAWSGSYTNTSGVLNLSATNQTGSLTA